MEQPDQWIRRSVIRALGRAGTRPAVARLSKLCQDSRETDRHYAISALGETGAPEAVTVLKKLVRSREHYVLKPEAGLKPNQFFLR